SILPDALEVANEHVRAGTLLLGCSIPAFPPFPRLKALQRLAAQTRSGSQAASPEWSFSGCRSALIDRKVAPGSDSSPQPRAASYLLPFPHPHRWKRFGPYDGGAASSTLR